MNEIIFVEELPPAPPRAEYTGRWKSAKQVLKEHPEQWGELKECPSKAQAQTMVHKLRKGIVGGNDLEGFEYTTRPTTDGKHMVYGRYSEPIVLDEHHHPSFRED